MLRPCLLALGCLSLSFGQTPIEADPNYNADTDPCFRVKSDLRYALSQIKGHTDLAKERLADYESFSNTKRAAEAAALDGLWSAAGDAYDVGKCVSGRDPSQIPVASLKLTRALMTVGLIVLPGMSGVNLAPGALADYNYHVGEAKKWGERARQLEERVRLCCSPYLKPPPDTNPPPNNPGGPTTTPGSGSGSGSGGAGSGGTGSGQGLPDGGSRLAVISGAYPDFPPSGGPGGAGSPTAGSGAPGPKHGFYGFAGYIPIGPNDLAGFNALKLSRTVMSVEMFEKYCAELELAPDIALPPNSGPPVGSTGAAGLSTYKRDSLPKDLRDIIMKCHKDVTYSAGYIVEEINMKNRRGHSKAEQDKIDALRSIATKLRSRTTAARAAAGKVSP